MAYGKHMLRDYEVWTDKSDQELLLAAGRWSEGRDHDDLDFELLYEELPAEKKKKLLEGVEFFLPEEVPPKRKDETTAEHITRSQEAEAKRQTLLQRNARSAFAASLLPTREEKLMKLVNAPASGEMRDKLDAIEARKKEDNEKAEQAREAARHERKVEGGGGGPERWRVGKPK